MTHSLPWAGRLAKAFQPVNCLICNEKVTKITMHRAFLAACEPVTVLAECKESEAMQNGRDAKK